MNLEIIKNNFTKTDLLQGEYGIEREGIRVTADGKIAMTPHPKIFGNKLKNPYITTDFSESQIEVVTPTYNSISKAHRVLLSLCNIVNNEIGEELFWTQSMPCDIPEDDKIPVALFDGVEGAEAANAYRQGLIKRYGGKKQLISGIHFNFSFSPSFFKKAKIALYGDLPTKEVKNEVYLKLIRNYLRYRWLIIYLTGASVGLHETYNAECVSLMQGIGGGSYLNEECVSFRNSFCGYKNKVDLQPDYESVRSFTDDVRSYVKNGTLSAAKELYTQIRMKAKGISNILESLNEDGIRYVEVRTVDLNPFEPTGVAEVDLEFLNLFFLYMFLKDEGEYADWQHEADINEERIAVKGLTKDLKLVKNGEEIDKTLWANEILNEIKEMNSALNLGCDQLIDTMAQRVNDTTNTYAYRMAQIIKKEGFIASNLRIAKENKEKSIAYRFRNEGFLEYELSTQILIKEALTRGVKLEEVDPRDNFIALGKGDKKTYVKQATKTERDSYISVLAMENKVVTKKILGEHNLPVPQGEEFSNKETAYENIANYAYVPVVIKPKSTNFGLGISIFEKGADVKDLEEAINIAFEYDVTVLVEEYLKGEEYRFLVIDGKTVAVLNRVAANVIGDGVSSIYRLAEIKSDNTFRGEGYTAPLKKIKFDEQTLLYLKQQGMTPDTVPCKGTQVFLRGNSNISTGGDSIDFTDKMPDRFKSIAEEAAKAVKSVFCGVDIIIEDYAKEESAFGIIELNFNPSTDMHAYPFKGKERRTGEFILRALGLLES